MPRPAALVEQAFAVAGALSGLAEGIGHVVASLAPLPAPRPPAPRRTGRRSRPLLNVVVLGDQGAGKSSLVNVYTKNCDERPAPTIKADLAHAHSCRNGLRATFAIWHLGSSEQGDDHDQIFYRLASSFMLVYDPSCPGDPTVRLEHWAHRLSQGEDRAGLPLVVVACQREGVLNSDASSQQAAVRAAQRWCRRHGVQHVAVRGLGDRRAIEAAFAALESLALQRWGRLVSAGAHVPPCTAGKAALRGSPALWPVLKHNELRCAFEALAPHMLMEA